MIKEEKKKCTEKRAKLIRELKELPPKERKKVIKAAKGEIPSFIHYATDPRAVKTAIKYVQKNEPVSFKDLRKYLIENTSVKDPHEEYRFGIVRRDGPDGIFEVDKTDNTPNWRIRLTDPAGKKIAKCLDSDWSEIKSWEVPLFVGLQRTYPIIEPMGILASKKNGMLLEDWKKKASRFYGGKEGHFKVGFSRTWLNRLGLLETEQVGRKKKYKLKLLYDF